jgi:hypothetical protein
VRGGCPQHDDTRNPQNSSQKKSRQQNGTRSLCEFSEFCVQRRLCRRRRCSPAPRWRSRASLP